ncbi:quinol:electron acceptor oxidoreductase subunit ActD [Calycomorphotria hydatis]|nr:quinol:electron acceptor oxidoreductase subunit ActD [Calycomorphotria hydatis]
MSTTLEPESTSGEAVEKRLVGLIGEFSDPHQLVAAAEKVRDAGYQKWDTYTPFPIHGIEKAMGIRPTLLPWIVLCGGLTGCTVAIIFQWFLNGFETPDVPFALMSGYEYIISGKPIWSLPANIPIAFELTILLSAFSALFGMLAMNRLLQFYNPLFKVERFARVTNDRFFLGIDANDPKFDADGAKSLLTEIGAGEIDEAWDDECHAIPSIFSSALLLLLVVLLIPPVMIARSRSTTWTTPRIHPVQDMDFQQSYKPQQANIFFADGRAARMQVEGTIARGELEEDATFYRGVKPGDETAESRQAEGEVQTVAFNQAEGNGGAAASLPPGEPVGDWTDEIPIEVTEAVIQRGKQRYEIFCAPCHGVTGMGDGPVNTRAMSLRQTTWQPVPSLHTATTRNRANGYLYAAITGGVRKMPAYGEQIPVKDRWAIVLYVRALQKSRNATIDDIPAAEREKLQSAE